MKYNNLKNRSGFTLIELLVVIAIITFLTATLTTVVGMMITTARVKATRSTIKKANEILKDRLDAFERAIQKQEERSSNNPLYLSKIYEWSDGWAVDRLNEIQERDFPNTDAFDKLKKIFAKKYIFYSLFGQRFTDFSPSLSPPDASKHKEETESSECFYYFLTQLDAFGLSPASIDSFNSSELQDTDGDGLMEIVDAWGNPIRFYRWPTRLVKPDGSIIVFKPSEPTVNDHIAGVISLMSSSLPSKSGDPIETNPLNQDPDDLVGFITTELNRSNSTFTATEFEEHFHTADTWHAPLIVSMGPDESLGLEEPGNGTTGKLAKPLTSASELDLVYDNITNMNLESGSN